MNKTQNAWQVRRKFRVEATSTQIHTLPDIVALEWNHKREQVTVLYDIRKTDYNTVLLHLAQAGLVVKRSFWSRLWGKMYQSTDQIGRENAAMPPAPCCNKPPK